MCNAGFVPIAIGRVRHVRPAITYAWRAGRLNARLPARSRFGKGRWAKNFHTVLFKLHRHSMPIAIGRGVHGPDEPACAEPLSYTKRFA
jgi:hypothetical protein